jgi:hypothetical protein
MTEEKLYRKADSPGSKKIGAKIQLQKNSGREEHIREAATSRPYPDSPAL